MWFLLERFSLPLGAWDGLRYFIVALPEPSYNYFAVALVGRYAVHIRKGFDFGRVISAQTVSVIDISNSGRCLQLMLF